MKRRYLVLFTLVIAAPVAVHLLTSAAKPTTRPALPALPAQGPPLPDFREPVDYIAWVQKQQEVGRSDDAAPLWAELERSGENSQAARESKARLWGALPDDNIPGLFTDFTLASLPIDYRWDPKDHLNWERSYELREAGGLRRKLLEIADCKYNVSAFAPHELRPSDTQPAIIEPEDHLLAEALLPSLASSRTGVKVLLQDAWRAPGGKVDPERLIEAIAAAIRIGMQHQRGPFTIEWLVGIAERRMAYDSAIRALRPGILTPEAIRSLGRLLARYDSIEATTSNAPEEVLASWLDLLQFAYTPLGPWPPRVNPGHLEKLQRLFRYYIELDADFLPPNAKNRPDDKVDLMRTEIWDAMQGAQEIVQLHQRIRELCRDRLPQDAERNATELLKQFHRDVGKHPIVRQLARTHLNTMSRTCVIASRTEAQRRAVHLLCRVRERYDATGQWPAKLTDAADAGAMYLIDPFSGKEFIYRVEGGEPTLYSVAMNGKDDGGRHDPHWGNDRQDADYVFWPVQARD